MEILAFKGQDLNLILEITERVNHLFTFGKRNFMLFHLGKLKKAEGVITIGFLTLLLFITRIISFREFSLDPDELEWLYDVRKCLVDPRPFVGFDAHTTGPFAIYFLTLIKLVTGFSQLYQLRLVSFFFFILPSLIFVYLMTRNDSKLLGSVAFVVLLCWQNFPLFGHHYDGIFYYNTEYQFLVFTAI